jgi:hypothetical protein
MTHSTTMLCHYPERLVIFTMMLNVIILSVVMLNVVAPPDRLFEACKLALGLALCQCQGVCNHP